MLINNGWEEGTVIRWLALALVIVLTATANILMKSAARGLAGGVDLKSWHRLLQPSLIAAIACFGLGLLFYTYALSKIDLSVAYPIMSGLVLVLVFLFSIIVLREKFQWLKAIGTLLILTGVILVTRNS